MARRPGAGGIDRHTLLSGGAYSSPSQSAYPRSHSPAGPTPAAAAPSGHGVGLGVGGPGSLAGYRSASPFEQPYASSSASGPSGSGMYQRAGASASSWVGAGSGSLDDEYGRGAGGNGSVAYHSKKDGGLLPGGYPSGGGGGGGGGGWSDRIRSYAQQRTAQDLEEANDERLEGLSAKVKMLKDITVGIGNEVRDSTKDLDVLGGAFTTTSAFLGGTFTRMNRMASRQSSWFCNMMMFILFVIWIFIFLWWWRR
ncbi:protein transport protein bet1 [Tilletia horrida]|nr:protein transport protein bet1 [Tilletia horrida]